MVQSVLRLLYSGWWTNLSGKNQWPLCQNKLDALWNLVQEQLDQGHLEPSSSP